MVGLCKNFLVVNDLEMIYDLGLLNVWTSHKSPLRACHLSYLLFVNSGVSFATKDRLGCVDWRLDDNTLTPTGADLGSKQSIDRDLKLTGAGTM